jgi:RHS repeat-associated protein
VLHRGASGSEDTAAISMFDTAGATGQANVVTTAGNWARGLFNSSEYTSRPGLTPHDFVYDLYQAFLPYAPDQGGWDWWTSQVGSNWQNKQTVLDAFINAGPYGQTAGTLYREVFWLMPDQLGTPRMIAERTGSLVGIKRHDYLPFGEELFAGQGVRTTTQGYSANESVRQKFTQKERDNETGLDYFGARYYASTQGRFTGVDPLLSSAKRSLPQSWNRYAYTYNNPLRFVDPNGEDVKPLDEEALKRIRQTLPETIRNQVKLDKNGIIDKKSLNKIKSDDQNFQDLKTMVNSSKVVEVGTASEAPGVGKFEYKSVEAVRQETIDNLIKGGFTPAEAAEAAKNTNIPTIVDGFTDKTDTGARIWIANGRDGTSTEPEGSLVVATGHELYGHAALLIQGKPWQHDDGGPVDAHIKQVEDRTRNNFQGQPTPSNQQTKKPPQ